MKKIITIIAALTLTLVSCKKESVLQSGRLNYHAVVEVYNDDPEDIFSKVIYRNGSVVSDLTTTPFNFGDTILIEVKNPSYKTQNIEIKLYANDNFIEGDETNLESNETLSLMHIF
jgi:hypothetical protein